MSVHPIMMLALAVFLIAANAGTESSLDSACGPCFNQVSIYAPILVANDPPRDDPTRQECLSEDSRANEGEEEDGDPPSLWGFELRPPSLACRGPLPCEVVALRQGLVGCDRDSRSALLRC